MRSLVVGNELKRKYGLPTAIAMVVGVVIGSGVFFKAEAVLKATDGNMPLGIAAWAVVGVIMLICALTFSVLASKYEKLNGLVDYAEMTAGSGYAYYVGWFMAVIYNPTLTAVLAWVSARYFCVLLGWDPTGGGCMVIAGFFLVMSFGISVLSPIIAGRFQVSTTVIKLIPLFLMALVGTAAGLVSGMTAANFTHVLSAGMPAGHGLFTSVVAVAFAYEGWIIATSINAELKDARRSLPRALVIGSAIVVFIYIFYYIGLAGAVPSDKLMESGQAGAKLAFTNIFGAVGGSLLFVFVIISCLGTLNGLMMGNVRGMYALAARGRGPKPEIFRQVDRVTNIPTNSAVVGLLLAGFWLLYFYGANLTAPAWFGPFCFDTSELPIITLYTGYIPIFVMFMVKEGSTGAFKRFLMPSLSIAGCVFMAVAACLSHGMVVVYYLIIFLAIMGLGAVFTRKGEV
jgi:APA family basic amino acid/polyamine antiporter